MRVEDFIRKNVVFVGGEDRGRFTPFGTGWWGFVKIKDLMFPFLVTAAHVVNDIAGDTISIRINRKAGGCDTVRLNKSSAIRHPDAANDLLLFPNAIDPNIYDLSFTEIDRPKQERDYEEKQRPFTGDEVCAVGLYTSHYGEAKNIPVVRIGNIAAMPEEPVRTRFGYVKGYLIEVRSIAGLSGSPVFMTLPPVRIKDGKMQNLQSDSSYVALGMLIGYHVVETKEDQIAVPQFQGDDVPPNNKRGADERNTGFAVVVPVERVMDIMEDPTTQKTLNSIADEVLSKDYKPASASFSQPPPTPDTANPRHKEDFTALLHAAAKTKPQAD